jgi:hypothetical protein
LGHAVAEIIEIIICRSIKEFLFGTHAEGKGNLRYNHINVWQLPEDRTLQVLVHMKHGRNEIFGLHSNQIEKRRKKLRRKMWKRRMKLRSKLLRRRLRRRRKMMRRRK